MFSTLLPKDVSTAGHTVYDPTASPTAKLVPGAKWNISYGDGSSASGTVYTDTVTLGGLVIKDQTVEAADTLSDAFKSESGDGLLGLAFNTLNVIAPVSLLMS